MGGASCANVSTSITMKEVPINFDSSRVILLTCFLLMLSGACGHKKQNMAQVPPAPRPAQQTPGPQPPVMPQRLPVGYVEEGIASWYGIPYHGRRAADGEIYDMETLVAAHKLMPFNTWLHVTNLSNGRTVNVRIIDRGPFVEGRIVDLSKAAARQIDLLGAGITRVRLEVIAAPHDIAANDFYAVQVGSFTSQANAEQVRAQFAQRYGLAHLEARNGAVRSWRVLVGKFPSVENARQLANVMSGENPDIFIVRLDETAVAPLLTPPPQALTPQNPPVAPWH
jgi:rare lipoprotein A